MLITTRSDLAALCRHLADATWIALDTEFVSEYSYRPQLCLIQVAAAERTAVIDPLAVGDTTDFWETIAASGHETVVHAGREETVFCLNAVGRAPAGLFDVQLAAGLVGLEYPAGYGNLISKLLGETPRKGETRTDWRRRPLSGRQIDYALDDVRYLAPLRDVLARRLAELGRQSWLQAEMAAFLANLDNWRNGPRWRKVAGSSSLPSRSQAIVRELWLWREAEAERRNCPVRRVLRDDLIVELAKRRSAEPKQIRALRGLDRGDLQRAVPGISQAIARALDLSDDQCPEVVRQDSSSQLTMLGQFLSSALGAICRQAQVAQSLVGTAAEVRELVAHRLGELELDQGALPALARGWRAEVVGHLLDDLLSGSVSIRIADPRAEQPLVFEAAPGRNSVA